MSQFVILRRSLKFTHELRFCYCLVYIFYISHKLIIVGTLASNYFCRLIQIWFERFGLCCALPILWAIFVDYRNIWNGFKVIDIQCTVVKIQIEWLTMSQCIFYILFVFFLLTTYLYLILYSSMVSVPSNHNNSCTQKIQ